MWVMTINGYKDVFVLEGGLPAWIGADGELTSKVIDRRDIILDATRTWNKNFFVNQEQLIEKQSDADLRLVDTRSAEQQRDTVKSTVREGRIPGSINITTTDVMRSDGTFKSHQELQAIFTSHDIEPSDDIIIYCLSTIGSGNVWLAFQVAGYNDAIIYIDGFAGWAADTDLPINALPLPVDTLPATQISATLASVISPTQAPTAPNQPDSTPEDGPTDLTGEWRCKSKKLRRKNPTQLPQVRRCN